MKHRIAIVDTGIDLNNEYFRKTGFDFNGIQCHRESNGNIQFISTNDNKQCIQDYVGHGTAVLGIILSHNTDLDVFIVKLYNAEEDEVDEGVLVYALEYIYYHTDCDIINLSLGISFLNDRAALYDICSKFMSNGRLVVAAFENAGAFSFPAEFDNVIGVSGNDSCHNSKDFYWIKNSSINVLAKGRSQRICWLDNKYLIGFGNSFACAHFSGILSTHEYSYTENKWELWIEGKAKGIVKQQNHANNFINPVKKYKRAVIFPFNKEMHSVVRFSDLLPFELVDVYETKYSAVVSAYTDDLLKEKCPKNYQIKNISDIDWDSFDTFVLGHTNEYFAAMNYEQFRIELIRNILERGKKLYTLDEVNGFEEKSEQIYHPSVKICDLPANHFDKLYRIDLPVIGVFGTGSKQGKFTLQLKLRREFLEHGYKITQIGTEPTALLYGMDAVYPVGYNSSVEIHKYEAITYLNHTIWNLSRQSELIMIGGQSGIIPQDTGSICYFNFTQLELLYAAMPDVIILSVNESDSLELIKRTIQFVESVTNGKVLAVVVFPMHYEIRENAFPRFRTLSYETYLDFRDKVEKQLCIPAYMLNNDAHVHMLYENIIDYFSGKHNCGV